MESIQFYPIGTRYFQTKEKNFELADFASDREIHQ